MRIFFSVIVVVLFGCKNIEIIELNLKDKIIIPKHYVVSKTIEIIEIDGIENETSWKKANYTDNFIDIEGTKVPKQKTNVKMLWDNNFLYVFAKLYETHIWGDITERDKVIYHNNDFEVFINPNKNVFNYGEIEINALGTEWDLFLNKPYRLKGKADSSWNIEGLESSVFIDGTINNPNDVDNYWTVEMAIPLKEILSLKHNNNSNKVVSGDMWRINFSRVNWDYELNEGVYSRKKENGKLLPEYNWVWSPQGIINMHLPENWGYLVFSENGGIFNLSDKLINEQILYAVFREVAFGEYKYLKNSKLNYQVKFKDIEFLNRKISCNFLKTNSGYKIDLYDENSIISIDETGKIKN